MVRSLVSQVVQGQKQLKLIGHAAASQGLGKHIWANPPDTLYNFALYRFVGQFFYATALSLAKLSILAFYWRFFSLWRSIRIATWILGILITLWVIGFVSFSHDFALPRWPRRRIQLMSSKLEVYSSQYAMPAYQGFLDALSYKQSDAQL